MGEWVNVIAELLWRQSIVAIPMIIVVAALTRWLPCRPATRHLLWATIIAWLCLSPILPHSGLIFMPTISDQMTTSTEALAGQTVPTPTATDKESVVEESKLVDLRDYVGRQRELHRFPKARSAPKPSIRRRELRRRVTVAPRNSTGIDGEKVVESTKSLVARSVPDTLDSLAQAVGAGGPLSDSLVKTAPRQLRTPPTGSSQSYISDYSIKLAPVHRKNNPSWLDECLEPLLATANPPFVDAKQATAAETVWDDDSYSKVLPPPFGSNRRMGHPEIPAATDAAWFDLRFINQAIVSFKSSVKNWMAALSGLGRTLATLPPIPTAIWLGGMILVFAIHLWGVLRFRRVLRDVRPASDKLNDMVSDVAKRMQLSKKPAAYFVDDCISPMICCGRRPKLIFPADLWSQLDHGGRRAVISHELAHLRRKDHWFIWADLFAGALYWWHPMVWWVRQRLHIEAEFSCDAWVTALWPAGRKDYAQALLLTKQYVNNPRFLEQSGSIGIISGRAQRFARRLTMVMTQRTAPRLSASGVILALSVGIIGWAATPAQSCPEKGCSKTSAKVSKACGKCKTKANGAVWVTPKADGSGANVLGSSGKGHGKTSYELYTANKGKGGVQYVLAGDRDDDNDLEERMERLERQLEKLMEKLGDSHGDHRSERSHREHRTHVEGKIRTRQAPHAPRAPRAPRLPRALRAFPAPAAPAAPRFFSGSNAIAPTVSIAYKLNAGQLEALTALMVLDDVPILVSPGHDKIVVHATPAQHASFGAFVAMISGGDKDDTFYELPAHKNKALSNLMARPDVSIIVDLGKKGIEVEGTPLEQAVFKAFVDLINPPQNRVSSKSISGRAFYAEQTGRQKAERQAGKKLAKEARLRVEEIAALAKAEAKQLRKRARTEQKNARKELKRAMRRHKHQRNYQHQERVNVLQNVTEKLALANIDLDELREKAEAMVGEETMRELEAQLSELAENGVLKEQIERAVRMATMAGVAFDVENIHAIEEQARAFAEMALDMVDEKSSLEDTQMQLEEKAEQLRDQAEQIKNRVLQMKDKFQKIQEENDANGDVRSGLAQEWVTLQEESSQMYETASNIQLSANEFESRADELSDRASQLDETANGLEQVAQLAMASRTK